MTVLPPVITIDGPSGSGKGTIAQLLAHNLGWHYLDSGAIYRAVAWAVLDADINSSDHAALSQLIADISIEMPVSATGDSAKIIVNHQDVTSAVRVVACSKMASQISAIPFVRAALLERQKQMRQAPGLVTDGRDMGTIVFPDASVKFFFQASASERAKRRYVQLKGQGKHVSLPELEKELCARDKRDSERLIAPLKPAENAIMIDTTSQGIEGVFNSVLQHVKAYL